MVKNFTAEDFDGVALKHSGVVLVDFYADWCGPCKMLAPILEAISNERSDVTIAKVNIDENVSVASALKIVSIPTMYIFKDGEIVSRLVGWHSKDQIIVALDNYLK